MSDTGGELPNPTEPQWLRADRGAVNVRPGRESQRFPDRDTNVTARYGVW